jgi:dTDP-glucose pyrophosphorylase
LIGFEREGLLAGGNIPADRLRSFALMDVAPDGRLLAIVEKPDAATFERMGPAAPVSMNLWSFSPVIFEACARVQPSARGELELQDAVRIAMEAFGESFQVLPCRDGVLDLSSRRDIPAVAARLAGVTVAL